MNIEEIVLQIVSSQADIEFVNLFDNLSEDLNLDSLDKLEIVMDLENEFMVQIMNSDAVKFKTVKDIVRFIEIKKEV